MQSMETIPLMVKPFDPNDLAPGEVPPRLPTKSPFYRLDPTRNRVRGIGPDLSPVFLHDGKDLEAKVVRHQ